MRMLNRNFYVSTELHCSALPKLAASLCGATRQEAQQIAVRMRNQNFGVSNEPIKRQCDSSSTTKFELARLLPLAVPITNGRTNGQTDGRTHIRKLIEGEIAHYQNIPSNEQKTLVWLF